jgi:hypothetical protein
MANTLTLKDVHNELQKRDYNTKLANVRTYYKDDPSAPEELAGAVKFIKQAQDEGKINPDISQSDTLSLAVDLVERNRAARLEEMAKVAAEKVAKVLHEKGITDEQWKAIPIADRTKIAAKIGEHIKAGSKA